MASISPGNRRSRSALRSGIAVIGAVFYSALGTAPGRATFVSAMVVAMSVNAALVAVAAAVTWLLPRRTVHHEAPAAAGQLTPPEPAEARSP